MAEQLLLAMRDDFINDATTLNLLAWLAQEGWQMSLGDGETPVDEAMTLHVPGTSDNDLATNVQTLDALIGQVARFKNPAEHYGMWLRTQLPGESGVRQALILEAQRDKAQVVDRFAQQQHMLRDYILGLKRTSAWEDTVYLTKIAAAIGTIGDMVDLGEVAGDIPARLARTRIDDFHGGISPFSNVWIGLRSNRFGIAAQFVPRWEAELGHLASNVAVTADNDATATGLDDNKSIRVTFTDPTMQPRWWMSVAEAAEFPDGQAGKMLVLGRFKVSDGSTVCRVRLESGFAGTTAYHQRGKVVVSGTDWVIYPLGQVTLPETGRGLRSLSLISNQRLRISADRYAGSGTLDMDCLILIPTDEGFISLQSETTLQSYLGPVEYPLLISRSADDRVMASGYQVDSGLASTYYSDMQVQVEGGMPTSDHVQIVLAAQRSTGSMLQDEVDLTLDVYLRWLTLRGADEPVVNADAYATLQQAIDATPEGSTLLLSGKTYEITTGLFVRKPINLRGVADETTIKINSGGTVTSSVLLWIQSAMDSNSADAPWYGPAGGVTYNRTFSGTLAGGETSFTLASVTGLSIGMDCMLLLGVDPYDATQPYARQFNKVTNIVGSVVTFETPIPEAINGTSHKCVTFDALIENITVENIILDYDGVFAGDAAIWFDKCRNVTCRNVTIEAYPGGCIVEASSHVELIKFTANHVTTASALAYFGSVDCSVKRLSVLDANGQCLSLETQNRRLSLDKLNLHRGATGDVGQYFIHVLGHSTDIVLKNVVMSADVSYPDDFRGLEAAEGSTLETRDFEVQEGVRVFPLIYHTGRITNRGTIKNEAAVYHAVIAIPAAADNYKINLPAGYYRSCTLTFDNVTNIGTVYFMPGGDIGPVVTANVPYVAGYDYTTLADPAELPFCVTEPKYLWFFSGSYAGGNVTIHVERFV